jgi:hypothetical protein
MRSIVEVGLCMLDTLALAAISTPLISRIFQPVPLEQQVRNAPLLIYVTLFFSLAAAYLALWRAATDFRVFRNMGAYLLLVGLQLLALYFGGYSFQWTMIAVTAPVLVRIAEEAMRIPRRRWTSLVWPLCLLVVFLGFFFPSETIRFLSIDITEIFLCILIVQGFRFPQKRDRQVAAAFTFLICFRWTLSPSFRAITHLPSSVDLRGWHWSLNPPPRWSSIFAISFRTAARSGVLQPNSKPPAPCSRCSFPGKSPRLMAS